MFLVDGFDEKQKTTEPLCIFFDAVSCNAIINMSDKTQAAQVSQSQNLLCPCVAPICRYISEKVHMSYSGYMLNNNPIKNVSLFSISEGATDSKEFGEFIDHLRH